MQENYFMITIPTGLTGRDALKVIHSAASFKSDMYLTYKQKTVTLKSVLGLMSLAIRPGSLVFITANGDDEQLAMKTITEILIDEKIAEPYIPK